MFCRFEKIKGLLLSIHRIYLYSFAHVGIASTTCPGFVLAAPVQMFAMALGRKVLQLWEQSIKIFLTGGNVK